MAEAKKEEVSKEEKREIQESVAKLVMGSDNMATIEVKDYRFKIHYPSVLESLKIQAIARNLRKEVEKDDDIDLRLQTVILATLDVACDEILKLNGNNLEVLTIRDGIGNLVRKTKFIEFVETSRNSMAWSDIIFPVYENYLKFTNEIFIKDKELKKF